MILPTNEKYVPALGKKSAQVLILGKPVYHDGCDVKKSPIALTVYG